MVGSCRGLDPQLSSSDPIKIGGTDFVGVRLGLTRRTVTPTADETLIGPHRPADDVGLNFRRGRGGQGGPIRADVATRSVIDTMTKS
jgi:hypothetical protein